MNVDIRSLVINLCKGNLDSINPLLDKLTELAEDGESHRYAQISKLNCILYKLAHDITLIRTIVRRDTEAEPINIQIDRENTITLPSGATYTETLPDGSTHTIANDQPSDENTQHTISNRLHWVWLAFVHGLNETFWIDMFDRDTFMRQTEDNIKLVNNHASIIDGIFTNFSQDFT